MKAPTSTDDFLNSRNIQTLFSKTSAEAEERPNFNFNPKKLQNWDVHLTRQPRHTFFVSLIGPLTTIRQLLPLFIQHPRCFSLAVHAPETHVKRQYVLTPSSHIPPQSCQSCICILSVHSILSFIIFLSLLCPCPLYMPPHPSPPDYHDLPRSVFPDTYMMCWQTAARGCATTTGGVSWIRTSGTASASRGGEGWGAMSPPRRSAPTARITREVGRSQKKPRTNCLLAFGKKLFKCVCVCASLRDFTLMWLLGDRANKQNKSIIHKTSLERICKCCSGADCSTACFKIFSGSIIKSSLGCVLILSWLDFLTCQARNFIFRWHTFTQFTRWCQLRISAVALITLSSRWKSSVCAGARHGNGDAHISCVKP